MQKLLLTVMLVLALAAGGWYAYQRFFAAPGINPQSSQTSGKVMKVGRYYWPGQYWADIADKKGWFQEAGLQVELVDTNPDYYGSLQNVVAGTLDTHDFYLYDLMSFNLNGAELAMVLNTDQSFGADGIIVKPTIASAQQLTGKRIGVTTDSNSEYLLHTYLTRNKVDPGAVTTVDVPGEQTLQAFAAGTIDGFVAWEPYLTEAEEKHQGKRLFDTSELPGVAPLGYAFRQQFIDERPGDIQAFVKVWQRSTQFIQEHPDEAFAIIAEIYDKTPGEVQAFAQQDRILHLQDNLTAFSYSAGLESLHGSARQINEFFIEQGKTTQELDSTKFIDGRFVRALK